MRITRLALAAIALAASPLGLAAPCSGFTDVDTSSGFCADVTWIANRGITLGCAANLYCPSDPVSRLTMAAFLHRLGAQTYEKFAGTQVTQTTPLASGGSETWSTFGWPTSWNVLWQAVPTTTGSRIALTNVSIQNDGDGTTTYFLTVENQGGVGVAYVINYSVLR